MYKEQYGCVEFPFSQDITTNSLKRTTGINSTIASCIKIFLLTDKGSRVGSSKGSVLGSLLHNLISSSSLIEEEEIIKKELTQEFPNVNFVEVKLEHELTPVNNVEKTVVSTLKLNISFNTAVTSITELSINLVNG